MSDPTPDPGPAPPGEPLKPRYARPEYAWVLTGCADPDVARDRALTLLPPTQDAKIVTDRGRGELTQLLHAAALGGYDLDDVARWADLLLIGCNPDCPGCQWCNRTTTAATEVAAALLASPHARYQVPIAITHWALPTHLRTPTAAVLAVALPELPHHTPPTGDTR